ncbi:helix-turn-helix domain-containing protein [Streptomyces sp. TP-A0874]|uniref:helix-turn-helix domain-containing protein n=1 Tax=Streptomyces sp. TP-A0874 TaxID=549819 RepID=UPI00099F8C12|nr:helix-turn-helix transcriptional regulator [Streptomyces sp. TP-A0874]
MAARPRELDPTESVPAYYGAELRRLRTAAGLSHARLGEIVCYSPAMIGHVETTTRMPTRELSEALDAALDTDGYFSRLYPLVIRAAIPGRYRRFMELEAQASSLCTYGLDTVPGLLQTEEYARAMLRIGRPRDEARLEELVAARMERQALLNGPSPASLWVVLDEAVVRRPVGGRAAMREQLAHLLVMAEHPNIHLQLLPIDHGEHAAMGSALWLLHFSDGPDIAYLEGGWGGQLIEAYEEVVAHQLTYNLLRANALPPDESAAFIQTVMEASFPWRPPAT